MWLLIEPNDVWLFRDGRPFSAGEGHIARSIFPPTPLTVQGALRSTILGHSNVGWDEFREQTTEEARRLGQEIGHPASESHPASLGAFSMAGPFLARVTESQIERCTPLPADVRRTKASDCQYFALQPTRGLAFEANWPVVGLFPLWSKYEQDAEAPDEPEWLTEGSLKDYLNGRNFSPLRAEMLFCAEPRFGVALDYSRRRPVQSMLYQAEFIRLEKGVGLLVGLGDGVSIPSPRGMIALGAEARSAHCCRVPDGKIRQVVADAGLEQPSERIKLVLLTPAYFDGGWRPKAGNEGWSKLLGFSVKLVAAAISRPQYLGGWDVAARGGRGWHKPMRAYVPAGSVYFLQADEPVTSVAGPVTHTPHSELPLNRLGFGQIAVGTWNWLDS
jgi:CRISPR-associated protein Cmr3